MSRQSVYVAASSDELDRARQAMTLVEGEGWKNALDWVSTIQQVGVANPVAAPRASRAAWSWQALESIAGADAVWLLAPEVGHARGAFVELGWALARQRPVVVSGPAHACSIFTALATAEMESDAEALKVLRGWFGR